MQPPWSCVAAGANGTARRSSPAKGGATHSVDRGYATFLNTILLPSWDRIVRRRDTPRYLEYLEASQWLHRERRAERELADLRSLLAYAGEHVPYYRDLFRREQLDPQGVASLDDLH